MRLAGIDLSSELQLHSVRAGLAAPCCSQCRRRPLTGELLHVYEDDKTLCTLCAGSLPSGEREPVRSERIRAAARGLAVVTRAA